MNGTTRASKIEIYADGANLEHMLKHYRSGKVSGFTTNPTLMRGAGIKDYEGFAKEVLAEIGDMPVSFEVFSDEFDDMERQALKIQSWGKNVYVKIPITNTRGESALPLIGTLAEKGVKLNVTAIFTETQLQGLREVLPTEADVIVSIFAGRLADIGIDPEPIIKAAAWLFDDFPAANVLWASTREPFNVVQAERAGADIITLTDPLLVKLDLFGTTPEAYSLDTVRMFYRDAASSGFQL